MNATKRCSAVINIHVLTQKLQFKLFYMSQYNTRRLLKLKENFDFLDKRCVCREHYEAAHHKTQTDSGGRPDQVNISIYRITGMFIPRVFQLSLKWLYGRGHFKADLLSKKNSV